MSNPSSTYKLSLKKCFPLPLFFKFHFICISLKLSVIYPCCFIFKDMTKTGKPDSYWHDIMCKYAQGKYHFSTGKKPGMKKWKHALDRINNCPLHNQTHACDVFGKRITCKCGYHKVCNDICDYCTYADHY